MWAASQQSVFRVSEVNRRDGAGPGGVLRVQVGCFVISELQLVFQRGPEQGMQESSSMMWQCDMRFGVQNEGLGYRQGETGGCR